MQMNAMKFDTMAREIFAPAYPLIAAQAVRVKLRSDRSDLGRIYSAREVETPIYQIEIV